MWIMHPIIGQPINRSLCVYMLDVLGFWEGNLCSQSCKVSKQWKKPEALCNGTMLQLQKAVCLLAMAPNRCLVKIERSHCCFLPFHFCFLGSVPSSKFCSSFCAPFRCLDGCSPLSWHPPTFDLTSQHRMRCKKGRLKETNQP